MKSIQSQDIERNYQMARSLACIANKQQEQSAVERLDLLACKCRMQSSLPHLRDLVLGINCIRTEKVITLAVYSISNLVE